MSLLRSLVPKRPRFLRGPRIPDGVRSPVIRTERLLLRPYQLADAGAWYTLQSDPEVVRYMDWPLRNRVESFIHLVHRTRHTRLEQVDDFLALAVVLDGLVIGDVSLHLRSLEPPRHLEIGWLLGPRWQGHGYAGEAAQAMLDLAFDQLSAGTVEARISWPNHPSTALARRLGFEDAESTVLERVMVAGPRTVQ